MPRELNEALSSIAKHFSGTVPLPNDPTLRKALDLDLPAAVPAHDVLEDPRRLVICQMFGALTRAGADLWVRREADSDSGLQPAGQFRLLRVDKGILGSRPRATFAVLLMHRHEVRLAGWAMKLWQFYLDGMCIGACEGSGIKDSARRYRLVRKDAGVLGEIKDRFLTTTMRLRNGGDIPLLPLDCPAPGDKAVSGLVRMIRRAVRNRAWHQEAPELHQQARLPSACAEAMSQMDLPCRSLVLGMLLMLAADKAITTAVLDTGSP